VGRGGGKRNFDARRRLFGHGSANLCAMTNSYVQHVTFNFIGTQFIILAVILMLGNYTEYRLLELKRFKALAEN
jgi:hypothetical protein